MATRSRIGIELNDGSILSVYHHWDGKPPTRILFLGGILETHVINTKEKVADLIDGGEHVILTGADDVWGKDRTDGNKYDKVLFCSR